MLDKILYAHGLTLSDLARLCVAEENCKRAFLGPYEEDLLACLKMYILVMPWVPVIGSLIQAIEASEETINAQIEELERDLADSEMDRKQLFNDLEEALEINRLSSAKALLTRIDL